VFLLTSFDVGGTERQMVELVRRLDRRRFQVHLGCFHRRGPLQARALEHVASSETFPLIGFRHPSTIRQMARFARWCQRLGARIVHTCELYSNLFGLPAAAFAGVEVRIGNRRELATQDKTRAQLAAQQLAYRAAHIVVANSQAAADQSQREGLPARKVRIIPNGLDISRYRPASNRGPVRRLIMVGNLRPEKGHDTLLEALPAILAAEPNVALQIVGDGALRESLTDSIRRRGLSRHVTMLGEREDVPELLSASDVFVFPSKSEAFPNAVLEAMASGLPVVASRVGGIPELIESGHTGVLVEPGNGRQLADATLQLIRNPERARAMGNAARVHVEQHFSFDRMVASFEELYLSILERAGESYARTRELVA